MIRKTSTTAAAPVLLCIVIGGEGYGVRRTWSNVFSGFVSRGWNVIVAVLDPDQADTWRTAHPGVNVVPSPRKGQMTQISPGRWIKLVSMVKRAWKQINHIGWLTRLAGESGAAVVMIHSPPESLLTGIIAWRLGLRALWLVPNTVGDDVPFDLNRRIYRSIFHLGKVVPVSNSRYTDSTFGPGRFERHTVHLGIDTDTFRPGGDPAPVRQMFGIPADAPVIGVFARMTPSKGQDRLVEALARCGTPFHLLLCGGPLDIPYAEDIRCSVAACGLQDRVHLAGLQADLLPYYAACDIIANMRVDPEPFGLTVVEAMACGKPVLAHRLGGPSETVLDGITGWLLPDVEIATIASALDRIAALRCDWPSMGAAGTARVLESFQKKNFIARIEEIARGAIVDK